MQKTIGCCQMILKLEENYIIFHGFVSKHCSLPQSDKSDNYFLFSFFSFFFLSVKSVAKTA